MKIVEHHELRSPGRDGVQEGVDRVEELEAIRGPRAREDASPGDPLAKLGHELEERRSHAAPTRSPSASASSPRHMLRSDLDEGPVRRRAASLPGAAPVDRDTPGGGQRPSSSASRVLPIPARR